MFPQHDEFFTVGCSYDKMETEKNAQSTSRTNKGEEEFQGIVKLGKRVVLIFSYWKRPSRTKEEIHRKEDFQIISVRAERIKMN